MRRGCARKKGSKVVKSIFKNIGLVIALSLGALVNSASAGALTSPVAYCPSDLAACSQATMLPLTQESANNLHGDLRVLDGKAATITLVYEIPSFAPQSNEAPLSLMVAPHYRNHCFKFSDAGLGICNERKLLKLDIPSGSRFVYTENTQSDDSLLLKPVIAVGTPEELQNQMDKERTPLVGLAGWYAFLALAAAFQMLTPRNRFASFCVAMMGLGMLLRTITMSQYGFGVLPVFGSELSRKLDYFSFCWNGAFAIGFYGALIQAKYLVARKALLGLYAIVGGFILVAANPEMVTLSVNLMRLASLALLVLLVFVVTAAVRTLKNRERVVLSSGVGVLLIGALVDLSMILSGRELIAGSGILAYCFAFETLCQFILIALSNDAAHQEAERLMLQTQAQNEEIAQKNLELTRLDALKDQFLANTSHELRTPLTGVIGILEPALYAPKDGPNAIPHAIRQSIEIAVGSARRLSSLVNDLMDFSKVRQGKMDLQIVPVDVHSAAEMVCEIMRPSLAGRPLRLMNLVSPRMPSVLVDPHRLQQILFNLLGNAIKFTEYGYIQISAKEDNDVLRIQVTDTGAGIPESALGKIFTPFEQVDATTSRKFNGMGLGLSIVQSLVHAHGGLISVQSTVGKGSTFEFTLTTTNEAAAPLENSALITTIFKDKTAAHQAQMAAIPAAGQKTLPTLVTAEQASFTLPSFAKHADTPMSILIVDDELTNRQALQAQLGAMGHLYASLQDGAQALAWIAQNGAPDLMLLDIMMPGMSGYEVLDHIRKDYNASQLPVLLMTAKVQQKDLVEGFSRGANDYIIKPYSFAELNARINHHAQIRDILRKKQKALLAQEESKTQTLLSQKELEYAKNQLQQADKMACLGQLVASVTHEINTPMAAISSSAQLLQEELPVALHDLPQRISELPASLRHPLLDLIAAAMKPQPMLSSRDERASTKAFTELLEVNGIEPERVRGIAKLLAQVRATAEQVAAWEAIWADDNWLEFIGLVNSVRIATQHSNNITLAVDKAGKIIKALKAFSRFNPDSLKMQASIADGIDTVLTIHQGQLKVGVNVVRVFEDVSQIECYPDELNQVWSNLIHNALQAMDYAGTLTLGVKQAGEHIAVSVSDTGCGIPEDIRSKIFDVFFTTKPSGVGSGLGLDIVKNIIDKHQGRIEVDSAVGKGTTFSVILPKSLD